MAAVLNSDDASDIFWPGYVDAIANLAINLLFVIAVMSIVVLGASLQLAELMKNQGSGATETVAKSSVEQDTPKNLSGAQSQKAERVGQSPTISDVPVDLGTGPAPNRATDVAQSQVPDTRAADKTGPEKNQAARAANAAAPVPKSQDKGQSQAADASKDTQLQAELEKLQERNRQLVASLNQAKQAQRAAEQQTTAARNQAKEALAEANSESQIDELEGQGAAETVIAKSVRPAPASQGVTAINARQNGLMVRFTEGALELSASEANEVITKLSKLGPVGASRWRITVVAPKGFSEALRLAYYRASAVRNVLTANGVAGAAIDMRVIESTRSSADNTLVSVRPQP